MADFSFLRKTEFWVTQIIAIILAFFAGLSYNNYENSIVGSSNSAYSVDQKGGITAGTIGNINISTDIPRRQIDAKFIEELNNYLPKDRENSIIITSVAGDSEALQFAIDLKKYLESQNWKVSEIGQFTMAPPFKGIKVNPTSDGSVEFWIGSMP